MGWMGLVTGLVRICCVLDGPFGLGELDRRGFGSWLGVSGSFVFLGELDLRRYLLSEAGRAIRLRSYRPRPRPRSRVLVPVIRLLSSLGPSLS